jgi:CBS domain-containing protein
MQLGSLSLIDASVTESASFAHAVEALFASQVPAIAVVDDERRVVGVVTERDVLAAVFPRYLAELRHTSFLPDDDAELAERAALARDESVAAYARKVEPLDAGESQTHAAERFLHTGEQALPVVDEGRYLGMLSISALCHARLDRPAAPD